MSLLTPVSSFRHQNCPLLCSRKSPEGVYINSQLTVLSHKRRKIILLWCSDLLKEIQATSSSFHYLPCSLFSSVLLVNSLFSKMVEASTSYNFFRLLFLITHVHDFYGKQSPWNFPNISQIFLNAKAFSSSKSHMSSQALFKACHKSNCILTKVPRVPIHRLCNKFNPGIRQQEESSCKI